MNEGTAGQPPPATQRIDGFQVRLARSEERESLLVFFPNHPLGTQNVLCLGAFAHPGDVPLGAVIVRPARVGARTIGQFLIFVRPECRRRKIGKALVRQLYAVAMTHHADQLLLSALIHQDRSDNAFYRACGMTPERSFATYSMPLDHYADLAAPFLRRIERSYPALTATRIEPLAALDLAEVTTFFHENYTGFTDRRLAQLQSGVYDLTVSCAAMHEGHIVGSCLCRTRPGEASGLMDLILTAPNYRNTPLPFMLFSHTVQEGMKKGITHAIFEADEQHDHFATGFARRLKISPQWRRYRYSISRPEIEVRIRDGF